MKVEDLQTQFEAALIAACPLFRDDPKIIHLCDAVDAMVRVIGAVNGILGVANALHRTEIDKLLAAARGKP